MRTLRGRGVLRYRLVFRLCIALSFSAVPAARGNGGPPPKERASPGCEEIIGDIHEATPFDSPEKWVRKLDSSVVPLRIYFSTDDHAEKAAQLLPALERAWRISSEMGLKLPQPMDPWGSHRLSVFLIEAHVSVDSAVEPIESTVEQDGKRALLAYILFNVNQLVNPSYLESLALHEFQHAVQTAYTWDFPTSIYEMSSNYFQETFNPGHGVDSWEEISHFQAEPDRSIFHDDGYARQYMYGAWIYLKFLELNYFSGKPDFLKKLWESLAADGMLNHHGLAASFAKILPAGVMFEDTLVAFARWRAFLDPESRAQAKALSQTHLKGREMPRPRIEAALEGGKKELLRGKIPFIHGTHYIEVAGLEHCAPDALRFAGSSSARWAVQRVPAEGGKVVVAIMALPLHAEIPQEELLPNPKPNAYEYQLSIQCRP